MDTFLDRCAESDPETAALLMAVYNEGVRDTVPDRDRGYDSDENPDHGRAWYELDRTGDGW